MKVLYNTEAPAVDVLKKEYDSVILAVGAYKRGELKLEGGEAQNALAFLEDYNRTNGKMAIGKNVVVIGGGNTAMDTARAAKRCDGVEHVYLVYRRTKRYMPADEHELVLAVEDGVEFRELLAPEKLENGQLICRVMKLGELDASGRAGIVETDETVAVPADRVIAAVGEKVPTDFYEANGLQVDDRGRVKVSPTLESSVENVYVIGDGLYGPSIVVKAMAQAITAQKLSVAVKSQAAAISQQIRLPSMRRRVFWLNRVTNRNLNAVLAVQPYAKTVWMYARTEPTSQSRYLVWQSTGHPRRLHVQRMRQLQELLPIRKCTIP